MNRHVLDVISECDVIIEVVDSRDIKGTRSRDLERLIRQKRKKLVIVINKTDLKRPRELPGAGKVVMMSAKLRKGTKALRSVIHSFYPEQDKVKVGVVGYANTGKSSLISAMGGKAKVSPTPGSTKGKQWLRVSRRMILLDSPGIIPENESREELVLKSSLDVNKIRDPEGAAFRVIKKVGSKKLKELYDVKEYSEAEEQLEELARKWKMLKKGAELDLDRAARKLLMDNQRGKL